MFTLIYSEQAAQEFGYNTAKTTSGEVVKYTCMHNEQKFGPWQKNYLWKDSVVVGKCNDYSGIIGCGFRQRGGISG